MPRKVQPPRDVPKELNDALEFAVMAIIKDPKSTAAQLSQAVSAGVRLLALRHTTKGEPDESDGHFFSK